jgi:hypothetical protein
MTKQKRIISSDYYHSEIEMPGYHAGFSFLTITYQCIYGVILVPIFGADITP